MPADPILRLLECRSFKLEPMFPALDLTPDEPRTLQYEQMLRRRRLGDIEGPPQFSSAAHSHSGKHGQHLAPSAIAKSVKRSVQG
jgi:hypothetical protein